MIDKNKSSPWVIGLALFSMFFGSGNLIYPLYVGINSSNLFASIIGFLLTGAFLPFLGVIAMLLFNGKYFDFFNILGKKLGLVFIFLILSVFIPFGSAPRCIALSFSSVSSYFNIGPIWIFSGIYLFLVYLVIQKEYGFLNILGKIITPLLISSIMYIFIKGMFFTNFSEMNYTSLSYKDALVEGYNTMDLIASFFFSASIITILNRKKSKSESLKITIKSSLIAVLCLSVIYAALMIVSKKHSLVLENIAKEQMLSVLAKSILGAKLSIISLFAILLACFSTSVALCVVFRDFLRDIIFKDEKKDHLSLLISLFVTYLVSLSGLKGISKISEPVLKIAYPILLVLIFLNIFKKIKENYLNKANEKKLLNPLPKND
jgi:LIVCS family branched-chain amino acid:cation transporter